ncbi:MAG: acetate/propionate family kinase [Candidatus Binatia bacterium]|nr:acetate/propionate family kinase [Candidatus Binatia bacterium]
MSWRVLVFNTGSSSVKFGVYRCNDEVALEYTGAVSGLDGQTEVEIYAAAARSRHTVALGCLGSEAAIRWVANWYAEQYAGVAPVAVGHRVVHGGHRFFAAAVVTPAVRDVIAEFSCFAPLHQPRCVEALDLARELWPQAIQVACFDTAFHAAQPRVARLFALPRRWAEAGLIRYGFHGLSFASIVRQLAERQPELRERKWVVAHLGSGVSLCAIADGRSVATTMGLTPLDGVPMSTRCGSIDPGVLVYLLRHAELDLDEVEHMLYYESGLKGLSMLSGDMRELLASDAREAQEAVELFAYRVQREVASLAGALQGLDVLVFTGGIGEHSPVIRERIASGLEWLGVRLDAAANRTGKALISRADSGVAVWVIPSDENGEIARETYAQLRALGG